MIQCMRCGSTKVRLSHLCFPDAVQMVALRYPLRCRECRHRWFANIFSAIKVHRSDVLRRNKRHEQKEAHASLNK